MCHLGFAGLPLHMHICFVHCQASSFLAAWALWYKPKLLPSATNHQHHFPLMQKWRKKACKMSAFPGSLPSMLEIMKIFNFNNRQMGSVIGRQWSQISYGFVWWLMQGMGVFCFVLPEFSFSYCIILRLRCNNKRYKSTAEQSPDGGMDSLLFNRIVFPTGISPTP